MLEKQNIKKEKEPKSFIRIDGKEHNFKALIDLLTKNGIKMNNVTMVDSRKGAERRVTSTFIPSMYTKIEVEASYDVVRRVLETSDEFREHADTILGAVDK